MKKSSSHKNKRAFWWLLAGAVIFAQALVIGKLFIERQNRNYTVNLVKINTEKDSIDYLAMKKDLVQIDHTIRELNSFLANKNLSHTRLEALKQDSLSLAVYLAKVSNRYSQHLVNLQNQLNGVPLGSPTSGYISSNFGLRKNPIPPAKSEPPKSPTTETNPNDSLTHITQKPAKEEVPMQFHKGVDFAVPMGSNIRSTAAGTVIFAGKKSGYGKCIIISHKNGLATLYGHISEILVEENDIIKVNQIIAKSGNSGRSTGPHLHYEVHKNNTPVNPRLFLSLN